MTRSSFSRSFAEYRTVSEAAEYLGVSSTTLRNWDRSGKLKPRRHPQNGYRIYLHEDLEAILRSADQSKLIVDDLTPKICWEGVSQGEHFVQFYETDEFLLDAVARFVSEALGHGQNSIVIATLEHRVGLQKELLQRGISIEESIATGRLVLLDAAETLAAFMIEGTPDRN